LNTATPRLLAAARSIWLTPMQNAPIAASCGAAARTRSVTFAERARQGLDLVALLGQPQRRVGMDVLEQQRPRGHQHLHLSPIDGHQPSGRP
jgi:Na+-transporting NADH:ubiquinone oxidoreductase subunit NqrA